MIEKIMKKGRGPMAESLRRAWAEIHLDRLMANAAYIKSLLSPSCRLMGVIKANAYGHGAVQSAYALRRAGVSWFGVATLDEAIELRRAGIDEPILILSYTPAEEAARLAQYRVTQTVVSLAHARALNDAAAAADVQLDVHIKVDTGMSRVGFVCHSEQDIAHTVQELLELGTFTNLRAEGIFTHFAVADAADDGGFTERQYARFSATIEAAAAAGMTFDLRHCCNSAATLRYPHMHLDMVRAGIILYGLAPDAALQSLMQPFRRVMVLKSVVSLVKELPPHTPLSYGCTYSSDTAMRVATIPIGYADGYMRLLSNRAHMLVDGQRAPVIGRICMDQCMLDVTDIPSATEGTEVTVFGDADVTADTLAEILGTINYEIVCAVSRRMPRRYYECGRLMQERDYLLD